MSPSSSSGGSIPLHHCKFVDYTPSSVTAIAFPPIPLPSRRRTATSTSTSAGGAKEAEMGLMAVGKGNGDVEIFRWVERDEGGQGWVLYRRLVSPNGTKIESLVFTLKQSFLRAASASPSARRIATLNDVRLFSSGRSSDLVEWDLKSGCILRLLATQSGSLWSLAPNPASTLLALGCEDGSLRLVSLLNDSDLTHLRRFERTKTRLLSIAWGPPTPRPAPAPKPTSSADSDSDSDDEDEEEWNDSWLVTGCSDSCLRKWDFKSGRVVERMVVEKEKLNKKGPQGKASGQRTIVWCVGVLTDGTVVSGDSMGNVKIWDSNTGTQISSFHAHGADVLCLAISPDNQSIFTSGIDQKTVQFSLVHLPSSLPSSTKSSSLIPKWIQSTSRRLHTHDVLSLAIFPPASPVASALTTTSWSTAPVLVSGGVDTSIVMSPCSTPGSRNDGLANPLAPFGNTTSPTVLGEAYYRKMGGLNGVDAGTIGVSKSEDSRLVVCRREGGLGVWRVAGKEASSGKKAVGGWEKVLEMELKKSTTGLTCSEVSADGKWLAVSDLGETKLFGLETLSNGSITPHRIRTFSTSLINSCPSLPLSTTGTGSSALAFSPDSSKLILATFLRGDVIVVDLSSFYEDDSDDEDDLIHESDRDAPAVKVLRVFEQTSAGGRVVAGKNSDAAASTSVTTEGDMEVDEVIGGAVGAKVERATVVCMAVGHDGQWLAVADLLGRTRVYNLDTLQLHSHLPTFPSAPPSSLSFLPNPTNPTTSLLLLTIPSGNQLHIYSVESRRFPPALNCPVPESVRQLADPVIGIAVDPSSPQGRGNVLMWGATWILRTKLTTANGGNQAGAGGKARQGKKKRARATSAEEAVIPVATQQTSKQVENERFKLTQTFRPMLGLDYVGKGELVVVERPWLDLVAAMPGGYFRGGKYGT